MWYKQHNLDSLARFVVANSNDNSEVFFVLKANELIEQYSLGAHVIPWEFREASKPLI